MIVYGQSASSSTSEKLGDLPEWDLSDLYEGPDAPDLKADLETLTTEAKTFQKRYEGHLSSLEGNALGRAIADYEQIQELIGRIMSYGQLVHARNVADPIVGKFYQSLQEQITGISTHTLFFTLELNRLDEDSLKQKLTAPDVQKYAPWLRDLRAFRPHQLSDDLEKLLHEKYVSGRAAWTRLFDETIADLRFPFDEKALTSAEILNLLTDPRRPIREQAGLSIGKVLAENGRSFALITNTLAKDKEIEDKWRGYARPISERNLANFVEDDVVDALHHAVKDCYPRLSHRYYKMKARWLNLEKLEFWDRNAPLPISDDRIIPWSEAQDIVLSAYNRFSPEMANLGTRFFKAGWIDAPVKAGKSPGAFAHPTVPSAHPYLLLNYQGKSRDVMTLAHELGHGVHQILAGEQGHLMANTPLTLAETASVFGEMLTFRSLLEAETDPTRRRAMLASKVEDMLNTVVRQIAMCFFERELHDQRRQGELTGEQISDIWLKTQKESFGDAIIIREEYRYFWAYIPHFIHVPFYVYAYAFGDCLVNSLYAVYQNAEKDFAEKYLDMLRAGGSKRHQELLAPFGLDASDPDFWKKGLSVLEGFIDDLEDVA